MVSNRFKCFNVYQYTQTNMLLQVCRNIDERITGEKEKLWEKIRENEDDMDDYKNKMQQGNKFK